MEKAFLAKFDESLGRLGLDHVEVLYLHNNTAPEQVQNAAMIGALQKAKKAGKARFIGITTHGNEPAVIRATIATKAYDVILTAYNFRQDYRDDLRKAVAEATAAGMGIVAMKTQAGAYWDKEKQQPINMRAALKWVLNDPNVTTAIPGFTTFDQLKEDFSVVSDIRLTPQDLADLRMGEQVAGLYCQHCGQCLPGAQELPLPDLRGYMYVRLQEPPSRPRLVGSLDIGEILRLLRFLFRRLRQGLRYRRPGQGYQSPAGRPRRFLLGRNSTAILHLKGPGVNSGAFPLPLPKETIPDIRYRNDII
jgi:hypothetical protein